MTQVRTRAFSLRPSVYALHSARQLKDPYPLRARGDITQLFPHTPFFYVRLKDF